MMTTASIDICKTVNACSIIISVEGQAVNALDIAQTLRTAINNLYCDPFETEDEEEDANGIGCKYTQRDD